MIGSSEDHGQDLVASLQSDAEQLKKGIHQLFIDLNIEDKSPWIKVNSKLCKQDESYFGDIRLCQQSLGMLDCQITAFNIHYSEDEDLQGLRGFFDHELYSNIQRDYYSGELPSDYTITVEDIKDLSLIVQANNIALFRSFKENLSSLEGVNDDIMSSILLVVCLIGSTAMLELVIDGIDDINNCRDGLGNTVLLNTFNFAYMEAMNCKQSFKEDNFNYLVEKGAEVDINLLIQAMIFADDELPNDTEKYDEIFRKIIEVGELSGKLDEITTQAREKHIDRSVIDSVSEICRELDGPSPSFR